MPWLVMCLLLGLVPLVWADEVVPLAQLFDHPEQFHEETVRVRGTVSRLELHVDETQLFIDFVFELQKGGKTLVVYGRHDRTRGDIQLTTGRDVEVLGVFWHERYANGYRLKNNLEALTVMFYPPLTPDRT